MLTVKWSALMSVNFSDADGTIASYAISGAPDGISIDNNGLISGTIDNSASQGGTGGVYSVTVTATDDDGAEVSETFTWTVTDPGTDCGRRHVATTAEDTEWSISPYWRTMRIRRWIVMRWLRVR